MATRDTTALIFKLQAQTAQLKGDLARAKAEMRGFQKSSNAIGKAIRSNLLLAFGGFSAAQGFRQAIESLAGFEFQMSKVSAISGATGKDLEELRMNAIELGKVSKFTATELGSMQEELARLGFSKDDIIDTADAVRKLATVADTEMGEAAKVMAATLNSFSLEAEESERVANTMAESFASTALDMEKFSVSIGNVGATAKAAGFSIEEVTALLGILVSAGIDASKAGTDLRKIFTEIKINGSTLEKEILKLKAAEDKLTTSFDQFGQRAMTSGIILSENIDKFKELSEKFSDSNMEMDEMVRIMEDNLLTDWKKMISAIDSFIQNGKVLIPQLREIVQQFTNLINTIGDADFKGALVALFKSDLLAGPNIRSWNAFWEGVERGKESLKEISDDPIGPEPAQSTFDWADALKKADENARALRMTLVSFSKKEMESMRKSIRGATGDEPLPTIDIPKPEDFLTIEQRQDMSVAEFLGMPEPEEVEEYFAEIRNIVDTGWFAINEEWHNGQMVMRELIVDFNQILTDMVASMITTLAEGGSIRDVFKGMFSIIGGHMQQLGKAVLAVGFGLEALRASLLELRGVKAIVAGAALIAAGALLKSAAGGFAGALGGRGGGGGGGGPAGSFANDLTGQTIKLEFEPVRWDGKEFVAGIREVDRQNDRNKVVS